MFLGPPRIQMLFTVRMEACQYHGTCVNTWPQTFRSTVVRLILVTTEEKQAKKSKQTPTTTPLNKRKVELLFVVLVDYLRIGSNPTFDFSAHFISHFEGSWLEKS